MLATGSLVPKTKVDGSQGFSLWLSEKRVRSSAMTQTKPPKAERLVIINDFGHATGGATSLALALAVGARKVGLDVTYITSGALDPILATAGVRVERAPGRAIAPNRRFGGLSKGLWRSETASLLRRVIDENDTPRTVYHLHNWGHFLSPSIFPELRRVDGRLAITAHDFFLVCPNGAQFDFQKEVICHLKGGSLSCATVNCDRRSAVDKVWRLARHGLRSAAFDLRTSKAKVVLIYPLHAAAMERSGLPAERLLPIRNPVWPYSPTRIEVERNDEVLFVGRLSSEKGPDLAAAAAAAAGARIRFVGDGPMRAELQRRYPDAIFDGFLAREEIHARALQARLAVMPGRWAEPFGMVALEALWSGLPVIVSENAYLAPEIEAAGAGIAVDPRNIPAFAAAIAALKNDDDLTLAMSERAYCQTRNIGMTVQDWEQAHFDLYDRLIAAEEL